MRASTLLAMPYNRLPRALSRAALLCVCSSIQQLITTVATGGFNPADYGNHHTWTELTWPSSPAAAAGYEAPSLSPATAPSVPQCVMPDRRECPPGADRLGTFCVKSLSKKWYTGCRWPGCRPPADIVERLQLPAYTSKGYFRVEGECPVGYLCERFGPAKTGSWCLTSVTPEPTILCVADHIVRARKEQVKLNQLRARVEIAPQQAGPVSTAAAAEPLPAAADDTSAAEQRRPRKKPRHDVDWTSNPDSRGSQASSSATASIRASAADVSPSDAAPSSVTQAAAHELVWHEDDPWPCIGLDLGDPIVDPTGSLSWLPPHASS